MSLVLYWGHAIGVDYDTLSSGDGVTTPALSAQSPTAGQTNVLRTTSIVIDVTNPVGAVIDFILTVITVDGIIVWSADSPQNGWTGSKAVVATGYRYTLIPPTRFNYGTTVDVVVYGENDQGIYNSYNYVFYIMSIVSSIVTVKELFIISNNVIMLRFSDHVAVTKSLVNTDNYTVSCTSGSSDGVVAEILPVTGYYVDWICIRVENLSEGNEYELTLAAGTLFDTLERAVLIDPMSWTLKRTKVDNVIGSLPGFYGTTVGTNLRAILEAIMISDESIGGDF